MVVLNSMNDPKATFGYDTNKVSIITSALKQAHYELKAKKEVARDIVKHVAEVVLTKQSFKEYIKVA